MGKDEDYDLASFQRGNLLYLVAPGSGMIKNNQEALHSKPDITGGLVKGFLIANLFTVALIPTGVLALVKVPLFFFVGSFFVLYIVEKRIHLGLENALLFLVFLMLVFFSMLNGALHGFPASEYMLEARSILSIYLLVIISYAAIKINLITFQKILMVVLLGHATWIVAKIIFLVVFFSGGASRQETIHFLELISDNIANVGGPMGIGSAYRIHSSIDSLSPFLFFFLLLYPLRSSPGLKKLVAMLLLVNVIISLSRYDIVALFLLGFLYAFLMRKMLVYLLLSVIAIFSVTALSEIRGIKIYEAIQYRFEGPEGELSTSVKVEQSRYLLRDIFQFPLFGKGLGSYVKDYMRNDSPRYGYEVFWLALWMQLGSLGMLVFLFYISIPIMMAISKLTRRNVIVAANYILFLGSGFTNSTIVGLSAAVMYVLFFSFKTYSESLPSKLAEEPESTP
jgi:hypothetical protein